MLFMVSFLLVICSPLVDRPQRRLLPLQGLQKPEKTPDAFPFPSPLGGKKTFSGPISIFLLT
jgi:hypothetical protein